jgi:hypothetical protein
MGVAPGGINADPTARIAPAESEQEHHPMQRSDTSPDDFLASLPDEVRGDMAAVDGALAPVFAGDERALWEGTFWGGTQQHIIGYGAYRYQGRSGAAGEWFVVGLAAQKNYFSLYVNATQDGSYLGERFAERLGKVKAAKANLQFKRASDLDLDVLREMAERARELTSSAG